MLQPGTSALFLMVEKVTPDKAVEAMSKYGGTVLKTSLSKDDEKELQEALHGTGPPGRPDELNAHHARGSHPVTRGRPYAARSPQPVGQAAGRRGTSGPDL